MVWNKEACEKADDYLEKSETALSSAVDAGISSVNGRRLLELSGVYATLSVAWSKKAERVYS